jgi:hypothetical protein
LVCHGNDPDEIRAGYDMRTLQGTLRGGESGEPAVVPGKPTESPLYLAVTREHDDWSPMPPKENDKLSAEQIDWIKRWIAEGAVWPNEQRLADLVKAAEKNADKWSAAEGVTVKTSGGLSPDWTNRRYKLSGLWAYQPVKLPEINNTSEQQSSARHPIDLLLANKMPCTPAPRADRRTLLRRATFDLIGLPPTPEQIAAFLNDSRSDSEAFAAVIERLLASPHYGEHWARHWLDVVRYADSSGFANDYERGNAWRYRDYVVRAFNNDKPYDQFIREQLAGDELAVGRTDEEAAELLVATGFLRMGPWELTSMEVAKIARQRFLDDVTNSVGETFLSHSLQCARCHDHKFDPVPTRDYYSIQAVFATTQLTERAASFLKTENTAGFEEQKYLLARHRAYEEQLSALNAKSLAAARAWLAEKQIDAAEFEQALTESAEQAPSQRKRVRNDYEAARKRMQDAKIPEDRIPPRFAGFSPQDYGLERVARKGLERLVWELDRYKPVAFCVYDGRTPSMKAVTAPLAMPKNRLETGELEATCILAGGDPFSPTLSVVPGALSVLAEVSAAIPTGIEGRRKAFADWVSDHRNPLTTRSIVNRIWMWHFGQALAGNPNNFGSTGKTPTHPELLDWLAANLVEHGWSIKNLHRLIMTSDAYCRSTEFPAHAQQAAGAGGEKLERGNLEQNYAVFRPRRLTAEEFRDAMLCISGELNPELGGIPNRPEINAEVALQPRQVMGTFASAWVPNPLPRQRNRRSLYALKIRGLRDPFMEVFNEPGPDFSCEGRDLSTVTPQVFSLFNSQASYDRALAIAARVVKETDGDEGCLRRLFELAFGRQPTTTEQQACLAHWQTMLARQVALKPTKRTPPHTVIREAVEENTGERFSFPESLEAYADYVPDLQSADVDARTRALADICLVILNTNEFAYLY